MTTYMLLSGISWIFSHLRYIINLFVIIVTYNKTIRTMTNQETVDLESLIKEVEMNKCTDVTEILYADIMLSLENSEISNTNQSHLLPLVYNNLGHILYRKVNFDDAIKLYTKAIGLDHTFSTPYYNRGTIHYRLGNYNLALKDMEKAVELEPTNSEFLLALEETRKIIK